MDARTKIYRERAAQIARLCACGGMAQAAIHDGIIALEAEVAALDAKPDAILVQRADDMHAILSDAIALLEMTDEGRTPGTDSYTVCVLGNEVLEGLPYASTVGRPVPQPKSPTLRDQFAMAAVQGIAVCGGSYDETARAAYAFADAMLAAREVKP